MFVSCKFNGFHFIQLWSFKCDLLFIVLGYSIQFNLIFSFYPFLCSVVSRFLPLAAIHLRYWARSITFLDLHDLCRRLNPLVVIQWRTTMHKQRLKSSFWIIFFPRVLSTTKTMGWLSEADDNVKAYMSNLTGLIVCDISVADNLAIKILYISIIIHTINDKKNYFWNLCFLLLIRRNENLQSRIKFLLKHLHRITYKREVMKMKCEMLKISTWVLKFYATII